LCSGLTAPSTLTASLALTVLVTIDIAGIGRLTNPVVLVGGDHAREES